MSFAIHSTQPIIKPMVKSTPKSKLTPGGDPISDTPNDGTTLKVVTPPPTKNATTIQGLCIQISAGSLEDFL